MDFDNFITHDIDVFMGKPKSGKTLIAMSYPKPLLYISIGSDGGGRVAMMAYRQDVESGQIKVKNLKNDMPVNGKIAKTSLEKLASLLAELRKSTTDKFKTIVIDTVGAMQDDYKAYLEFTKMGKPLSQPEWGEVAKMMFTLKDNMKRFSEETQTKMVWIFHTRELEVYETSGLNKEIRIIPDVTVQTGIKYLKDASNIFYCCRKTVTEPTGNRTVKFLTYVGPHPLMDTGTRDILLSAGDFVENFTYDNWQKLIAAGKITGVTLAQIEAQQDEQENRED